MSFLDLPIEIIVIVCVTLGFLIGRYWPRSNEQ